MPSPYRAEHDGYIRNYLETGDAKIIGIGREVVGLRKNGQEFPIDLAVSEVEVDGNKVFAAVVRDISDRRILEQVGGRRSSEVRRLSRIGCRSFRNGSQIRDT